MKASAGSLIICLFSLLSFTQALRYAQEHVGYNLNENETAVEPKHYNGIWANHTFQPSPSNWRFPFYVLTLDRFIDGDPTNNEANGTVFEHDWMSNQFRFGGDAAGVLDNLDYIQGMGLKAIYFTGSMMLNMPWSPDGFGPLDFTLLDRHHGNIEEWRIVIDEIHSRGMYVVFDNTMATMADLLGYGAPYTNATVEYSFDEYDYIWKDPERRYHDFQPSNDWDPTCKPPPIWEQNGYLETQDILDQYTGCRDSEFDMYGDILGTGAYPSYVNQFSRFASVQDRLREWRPDVLEKINVMSCIQIQMLDLDGFRMDKGVQTTLDAMADFSTYQRECARRVGKDNFLMVGEVVSDPKLAATYFGRGKKPDQALDVPRDGVFTSNTSDADGFIRPWGRTALDGAAFHYDIYGSLTRFLGLDGPWGSLGVDWVDMWNTFLKTHDLVNANTGLFDPRHMYGTTNQDVFRWPALANGTERQLLGMFVTSLELPGMPMVLYGEEQQFYTLENAAPDYVYGRTPMASQRAWQLHGCYNLGELLYVDMPFNSSSYGCYDDSVSLDHRDPSHPMRNILKRFFELREQYPTLNDGFNLTTLSTRIYDVFLRGSQGMSSPTGLWSVFRGRSSEIQDLTGQGHGNQPVWLLFHNENRTVTYDFDCASDNSTSQDGSMISAFPSGTTVRNLLYPYESYDLEASPFTLGLEDSTEPNGCIPRITFRPWEFKAFVPANEWEAPKPVITRVMPGHDARLLSSVDYDETESVPIQIHFSEEMDCDSVRDNLKIESFTETGQLASLNTTSIICQTTDPRDTPLVAQAGTTFVFGAILENVGNGVHTYTVDNATTTSGNAWTNARDKFMFRIGAEDNPMIFPESANYTKGLLQQDESSGDLFVIPKAAGADLVRYSTNWGSSYSDWKPYTGGQMTLTKQSWSGAKHQEWEGEHVIMNYWSKATGSSDHYQHADLGRENQPARRWPHAFVEGVFNQWGYDLGISNQMRQNDKGEWVFDLFTEWPTNITLNVWGMNPDGYPDKSAAYGDIDRDGVLDWVWPNSIANNFVNISAMPAKSKLGYRMVVNDGNFSYSMVPHGSAVTQLVVLILLAIVPFATALIGVKIFISAFYKIKFNRVGLETKTTFLSLQDSALSMLGLKHGAKKFGYEKQSANTPLELHTPAEPADASAPNDAFAVATGSPNRKTVLIATAEYEIEDYAVKIKIGGLGVMASLMGKSLGHQNLIWVVPCVGGVDYPFEDESHADPIEVRMMNQPYFVETHVHVVKNITYVLLDSPIFRKRTKAEPYPPRMDDLDSGLYYSAWNQCIAEALRRYKPDLYHINDYHGAAAPLYLLPDVIPCCLSLHNAEFQGMWPLRTKEQMAEMSRIFNLNSEIIKRYVQFGEVFNLLHAGASYLRIHQQGFGAVGVSKKYGKRSLARYPILWGLENIGALPNPDPSDTAPIDKPGTTLRATVDPEKERERGALREQAQQWAGLNVDPNAELFIFVGRWSLQKGIDLIADVFPWVLEKHKNTQLIAVGPVIDLYGRFAALKLAKLMEKYPGRVFSKPEFTALPPYLFGGAEFALMPSRDEPFGLVAVEFGRKGALCVGARVGGFGHMPGWWFTVEAVTTKHLASQFKNAISAALASDYDTRAMMRAYSLLQRFPVAQWVKDLETLQGKSIEASHINMDTAEGMKKWKSMMYNKSNLSLGTAPTLVGGRATPHLRSGASTPWAGSRVVSPAASSYDLRSGAASPMPSYPDLRSATASPMPSYGDLRSAAASPMPGRSRFHSRYASMQSLRQVHDQAGAREGRPGAISAADTLADSEASFDFNVLRASLIKVQEGQSAIEKPGAMTPTFNDTTNAYYDKYSHKLDKLNAKKSLPIEEYIVNSEKEWFNKYHAASLKGSRAASLAPTRRHSYDGETIAEETTNVRATTEYDALFGNGYVAPTGARKFLQRKIGTWYLYCFLLAFGQIISASSYQLTLLTGAVGEPADKLYVLCSIYLGFSFIWWVLYRTTKAVYCLSAPFLFFGLCFLLLAASKGAKTVSGRSWMFDVAAGIYAAGSAAGSMYFSLNFGTEGGTPSQVWAFRACVIAGSQQFLIAFLWYWGSFLTRSSANAGSNFTPSSTALTAICIPLALLMFGVGILLYLGLPDYYRQDPGAVPSFYRALLRRGIILWFWVMVILQNYWLSPPYNRNWLFLWSSQNAPAWAVALLVILFFGFVWAGMLAVLGYQSKQHSWIIPIFAIGLGAPRWCQMLWSLSGIGFHVPWGGLVGGALVSRAVWLWLGVLDALQGVGFGMILLMTLTRLHITFTLVAAQMIGALFTILGRVSAPDRIGAGTVFINLASDSLASVWFWVALICQLIICVGYLKFFRKAQLMKP
ncbi:hypothetical protein PMZ80_010735 [Knufia obscura]|uniref:alpha-1,3-glucan synthase n=1 Tax=Knufia obscura TaxID=1635080 RepID=A0ABR0R8L8_9EURO|nr:hypothetical protein PMZ80_010735 [Knufia obscura]